MMDLKLVESGRWGSECSTRESGIRCAVVPSISKQQSLIMYYNQVFKLLMADWTLGLLLLLSLATPALCAALTRQNCTSSQILNPSTLKCVSCPGNMVPNPSQAIPVSCVCQKGFIANSLSSCIRLGPIDCSTVQFYDAVNIDGSYKGTLSNLGCSGCANTAQSDGNGTGCIRCGRNEIYSVPNSACECSGAGMTLTKLGCFTSVETASTNSLLAFTSSYNEQIRYLFPSCAYFNDILSCSHLVNLCTYSLAQSSAVSSAECKFFDQFAAAKNYLYFDTSAVGYSLASTSFKKNQALVFKLVSYLPTGNYVAEKQLRLVDIFRCGVPANNSAVMKIGNNVKISCSFNFNNLVARVGTRTYNSYVYQLFLKGTSNEFFPVKVYLGSNSVPVNRFYLEDTYSSSTSISVANSIAFKLSLNSTGHLNAPQLRVGYKKLTVQNGAISPDSDKFQTLNFEVSFVYELTTFWGPFIGIFVTVCVLAIIQAAVRTYIAHLNRQSLLGFFFYLGKFWSMWLFYFLMMMSGYWFLFSKITQDAYIFTPSVSDPFYIAFYIIAGFMGLLRIIVALYDKKEKLGYEVFMINWEKAKNSWRQIFIVNSLAEFYTYRTISFFWLMLCLLFFLVGLKWQDHAAEVAHADLADIFSYNTVNRVFLYFLCATVFLVIGVVAKILRRISTYQWPYPFEDFVDYCNVTNISFFFMKKRSQQAFYLHASMPDRAEVTYKQINEAIRRGLNKSKTMLKQLNLDDNQRLYIFYTCKDLQDKFNLMLKKCEDEEQEKQSKINKKYEEKKKSKHVMHPREQFVEKKLKPYLAVVERDGAALKEKTKSLFQRLFGLPAIDLREGKALTTENKIIFDDNADIVPEVFPNGDEFEELHTIIIIFLMFLLMTANVCAAALITYFVDEYIINRWISRACRSNLEKMTRVKQGFML